LLNARSRCSTIDGIKAAYLPLGRSFDKVSRASTGHPEKNLIVFNVFVFIVKVLSMNAMPSTGKNRSGRNYLMRFIVDNDNERWTYDENDNDAENDENDQILDRKEAIRIRI